VVALFEELTRRAAKELGPAPPVGHGWFLLPAADESALRMAWEQQVLPQLREYAGGDGPKGFEFDRLWSGDRAAV
jgi:hypothetical protein